MKVEGKNAVYELLNSAQKVNKILILNDLKGCEDILKTAKSKSVLVKMVSKQILDSESVTNHHQGIIAFVDSFTYCETEDILNCAKNRGENPFILIVDEISDPHNLGSLIRTCECAGVSGIILQKNRSVNVNETVVKVSTGAVFNVNIARVTNINDAIRDLKKQDIVVYSLEAGGKSIYSADLTKGIALIVGSEGFGVGELTKKLSDMVLSLPMKGKINSLNASVAGGIAIYEVVKQRLKWICQNF